ncbi:hypothetical protein NOVOSPHI9U_420448 [Novosphingobium sp. 9U]|nr:hypothetical protein NOVOSPHI9U_420448 [Novosphingobium sp. 9U]
MHQINQPPAHDAVSRRERPASNRLNQSVALRVAEDQPLARSLAVEQPVRAAGVKADHPVADDCNVTLPIRAAWLRLPPS